MKKSVFLPIMAIFLAAAVLLGVNFAMKGFAQDRARARHLELLQTLLPGSDSFTLEPYDGEDANILSIHKGQTGFVVQTRVEGYAGEIVMYVGVSDAGKVTGLVVQQLQETLGLGANALGDHEFLAQFLNTDGEGDVDALTGATVTSRAIARSVRSAVAWVTGADVGSGATSWGG